MKGREGGGQGRKGKGRRGREGPKPKPKAKAQSGLRFKSDFHEARAQRRRSESDAATSRPESWARVVEWPDMQKVLCPSPAPVMRSEGLHAWGVGQV